MVRLTRHQSYWLEVAGFALAAVVLFRFGLLVLVFLVPIQLVWVRRGEKAGIECSLLFLAALAVMKGVDVLRLTRAVPGGVPAGVVLVDLVVAFGFVVALFVLNTERPIIPAGAGMRGATVPERMLASAVAGATVLVPALLLLGRSGFGEELVAAQVELLRMVLGDLQASDAEIAALARMVVEIITNGLLLGFFVIAVGNWWLGIVVAFRGRMALPEGNPVMARTSGYELTQFRLPVWIVWVLIAGWSGVVVVMLADLAAIAPVVWNVALVSMAVYGIQGIAIVWFFLARRKATRGVRALTIAGLVLGLFVPGMNLLVSVGLPGLGVSEIWINYHRFDESEDVQ